MKIKKYVAPSMPEAMKKIRAELGSDAVILNSKVVQSGGFFGLFAKKNIEVIAAIDAVPSGAMKTIVKQKPYVEKDDSSVSETKPIEKNEINGLENKEKQQLLQEIVQLKTLMKDFAIREQAQAVLYPGELKQIHELLCAQEVHESLRQKIMQELTEKWYTAKQKPNYAQALSWLKHILADRISHLPFGKLSYEKKYVNVVGPTGVGKTTTIAKIAAKAVLKDKKKVAFITTDTYRIAAIDQLKTYAQILCIPLEVCYTVQDFKRAMKQFANYDVVLIDTAGRNFRNHQYVDDLKEMIEFDDSMETYLVLSLTAKQNDMEAIYEQFSSVAIHQLIFTKVDETTHYGSIINMVDKYDVGVAYITNGQDVPDDIIPADPNDMMNIIFGD